MKRTLLQFFIFLVLFALVTCSGEPAGIAVGFSTELRLRKESRVPMNEWNYRIFTDVLQVDPATHFSGKLYVAFDTIYTSVVKKVVGNDTLISSYLPEDCLIYQTDNQSFMSVFYQRKGWFVYRTIAGEPAYRQVVILDVAGRDSATIAGYFEERETRKLIK